MSHRLSSVTVRSLNHCLKDGDHYNGERNSYCGQLQESGLVCRLDHVIKTAKVIMREYGIYEAKTKLPDLIKQVGKGERITITNRGEPVADLVPSASRAEHQTRGAIAAIKAMRTATIDQEQFSEMRLRGRR